MKRLRPILAILLVALVARTTHAQGTSGIFVDPIAGRDLDIYAARLAMSPQQRFAVDRYHDAYLDDARALREGPIQAFLDASGNLMRTFMFAPDARAMGTSLRTLDRINERIRANDERLFDQVLSVLSEEQAADLTRVRRLRERERLLGGAVRYITYAHPVLRVDIARAADEIDLSPADRAILEPLLPDYESRLTAAARRLARETRDMFEDVIGRIEDLGLGDPRDGNTRRRAAWQEMRAIWLEASRGVIEASTAVAEINRRSARSIAAALSSEGGRRLTDEFRRRAFRDIHEGSRRVIDRYTEALSLPHLAPEKVRAIASARDTVILRHDRLAEEMIDVVERMQRQAMLRRFGGREAPEAEEMAALEQERDAINEQAHATLDALLGPAGVQALARGDARRAVDADKDEKEGTSRGATGAPPTGAAAATRKRATSTSRRDAPRRADPFLPNAISGDELTAYRERLGLSADQGEVMDSLYANYLEAFAAVKREHIDPVVEHATNLWSADPNTGRALAPGPAAIDALFAQRRAAFAFIRAADEAFLHDVATIVIARDDAAQAAAMVGVRRARDRVAYNVGVDPRTGMPFGSRGAAGGSNESSVDLAVLFDAQRPPREARARVASILEPYEHALVRLFRQRYDLALSYAAEHEAIRAAASHARDESKERRMNVGAEYRRLSDGTGAELRRVAAEIIDLNRTMLQALAAATTPPLNQALRTEYRRIANPDVFDDGSAVGPRFRRALALEDMAPEQRARIGELFAEYRVEYERLAEALVALDRASTDAEPKRRRPDWRERQQRRNAREQIEFQRSELNEKALRRLRAAVDDEQATRLGLGGR